MSGAVLVILENVLEDLQHFFRKLSAVVHCSEADQAYPRQKNESLRVIEAIRVVVEQRFEELHDLVLILDDSLAWVILLNSYRTDHVNQDN